MPFTRNPIMLTRGLAPAAELARRLSKGLTTIHSYVRDEKVRGERDGRMLYVDLASLEKFFRGEDNTAMADAVVKYRAELAAEFPQAKAG